MSSIILLFFKSNLANTGLIVDLMDFFTKLIDHTTKKVGN